MKKTLLATAIAGAVVASGAQAATLYDQDGTKLEVYGRIALGISGGGNEYAVNGDGERIKSDGTEFRNVYSRFGLRGSQRVTDDLTAFGNFELRPKMNEVNRDGQQVRNSYLGLRSNTYGTIQAGNFDSFYLDAVSAPFDVYIDRGLEFTGGSHYARGNSIGYITPDLSGFKVYLMGKLYTGNGQVVDQGNKDRTNESQVNTAGGAVYEVDGLRLALGYAEARDGRVVAAKENPNRELDWSQNGENIYGGTAAYAFNDDFSTRIGYEQQKDNRGIFGIGMTAGIPDTGWSFNVDYYHVSYKGDHRQDKRDKNEDTTRNSWAAGAYYDVSSNFELFAELHEADQSFQWGRRGDEAASSLRATRDSVYWLTGARYFF
ncbi:porin [Halomonas halocynthiae]|uniref:porin n=1 Tax=Halomonas halocynthiae TaxID=176290 RepID=UPI0004052547|nr:porin [Halomonas halocynthiae]